MVDSIDDVDPEQWDAAVRANELPVFYSHAFLSAYQRHPLAAIDAFAYLTVRWRGRPGPPAAVVPAYLQARPDPLGCLAGCYPEAAGQPALLSHTWHCYDSYVCGPSADPAVAATVLAALRHAARDLGAPWCGVVSVLLAGPSAAALVAAGHPVRPMMDRYGLPLAGVAGLDDYLMASVSARTRHTLRWHTRRGVEHGVRVTALSVADADLTGLTDLCDRTARRHGSDRFYPVGSFEPFLAALGDAARVIEVRQRERLVGAGVCLVDDRRLHSWAAGIDYDVDGNYSPYWLLWRATVELGLRLGLPDLEGGRGNPTFKLRLGLTPRPIGACVVAA